MGTNTTINQTTQTTSNIGPSQEPYYRALMQAGAGLLNTQMPLYDRDRVEGFTDQQKALQTQIAGMQTPTQFAGATTFANAAGLGALQAANYTAGQFNPQQVNAPNLQQYQMGAAQTNYSPNLQTFQFGPTREVNAQNVYAQNMQAAQTGYNPNLQYFQMSGPQQFGGQQAQQYMSPFIQQALEPQMREAVYSAKRGQLAQDLGAARQGTYGGSRQLLASLERERNLGQQLGDIQSRGMQSAYENAQAQFERDRAAQMQAQQANLQANLGVQQLGTQTGLQTALANLSNEQQARVNNQAQQFQAQGMNAENALRAALANQGVDVTRAQANLQSQMQTQELGAQQRLQVALANLNNQQQANVQNQAAQLQTQQLGAQTGLEAALANQQQNLEAQRLREQSRQFGAQQSLAAYAQANQAGQTMANIGQAQQNADIARYGLQTQTAAQQQALNQQMRDIDYQDFLRELDYPYTQLQRYGNLLSGVPVAGTTTTTTAGQTPGLAQQLVGGGLGAYSTYKMLND